MQPPSGTGTEPGSSPPASPPAAPPPPPPSGAASPPAPPPSPPAAPPSPPTRPDYIPEGFWDGEKNTVKADEVGKIFKSHADRQADLITDVAGLKLTSKALKTPDGNPIEFTMDAPIMKAAATMAKERGWTKSDLTAMAELVAAQQMATMEFDKKEFLSLGSGDIERANARYNAVMAAAAAKFQAGEDGKGTPEAEKAVAMILQAIPTKAAFEVFEKLVGLSAPTAAPAGGAAPKPADIAKSWYGEDGLSGPGLKKAS